MLQPQLIAGGWLLTELGVLVNSVPSEWLNLSEMFYAVSSMIYGITTFHVHF